MSDETVLRPELPPGFLLQLGRVIVRGSELAVHVRAATAALGRGVSGEQPRPAPSEPADRTRGSIDSNPESDVHDSLSESLKRARDWLDRSQRALEQRDQLVQSAPGRRPGGGAPNAGAPDWTEEELSALVAAMVDLIIEARDVPTWVRAFARDHGQRLRP